MKYQFLLLIIFLFTSCQSEKVNKTSSKDVSPKETLGMSDVLKKMNSLQGDFTKQKDFLRDQLKENFDQGQNVKAESIFRNVLFSFGSEESIKELTPIFLHQAQHKTDILPFFKGIQSAYYSRFPNSAYAEKAGEVLSITDLLNNKKDLINNPNFNRFSIPDAKDYIAMSEAYMLVFPENPDAGTQIVNAGNIAKSIRGYGQKAIDMYDMLLQKQPNHPKTAQALFLQAFTYDNEVGDKAKAESLYKEFIKKYPDDEFADDAQLLLENVNKSDEEFYQSILNKNKESK